jgi:hypothetical protein
VTSRMISFASLPRRLMGFKHNQYLGFLFFSLSLYLAEAARCKLSLLGWVTPLVLETNGESLNHRCYHSRRKEVIGMGKGEVVGGVGV